jgi:hypothetical protein
MTKIERSYINAAYWAPFLKQEDIHLIRKFLYLFIMDIGIFPFEKCYDGKSIISACVTAGKPELLKELLMHDYVVHYESDLDLCRARCKAKDSNGNNFMHHVFILHER